MKRVLKISINVESGKKMSFGIEDPATTITKAKVETAINNAINSQYFLYNNSEAVSINDYYIYETNTVAINGA